jgi:hypothetical protein
MHVAQTSRARSCWPAVFIAASPTQLTSSAGRQPPDLIEISGHVGKPAERETGGWDITLGAGLSPTIFDFHVTGMRILNSGRLPLSVLSQLEMYRPTFFLFGQPDQIAALAAASPGDTVVITGYRRVGSRNLMLTGLRVAAPVTPMPTPLGIE